MRNHILLLLLATHHLILAIIAKNCTCPKKWPMKRTLVCGKELNHLYKNDHCDPERYYVCKKLGIPAIPDENCAKRANGECELVSALIQDCHSTECCDDMLQSRHCMDHKYSAAHELTYYGKTIEEITETFKFAQNFCYATNRTKYKVTNTRIKDCEAERKKINGTYSCYRGGK